VAAMQNLDFPRFFLLSEQEKMSTTSESNCIFCQIAAGLAPSSKFYEDDRILGFMTLRPKYPGECLLIPKTHIDHFMDLDDDLASRIIKIEQRAARKMREKLRPRRVGYVVSGYDVPHAHLIILPSYDMNDITSAHYTVVKDGEIHFTEENVPPASREELDRVASLLSVE
jgi:histidine triad (HIT) family protein